ERLLVERVLQDRFHALVAAGIALQGPHSCCFHARCRVAFGKPDDAQARAIAHLRMWLLARMRSISRVVCGPICSAQCTMRVGVHSRWAWWLFGRCSFCVITCSLPRARRCEATRCPLWKISTVVGVERTSTCS